MNIGGQVMNKYEDNIGSIIEIPMIRTKYRYQYGIENSGNVAFVRYKCNNRTVDNDILERSSAVVSGVERIIASIYMVSIPECRVDHVDSDLYNKFDPAVIDENSCKAVLNKLKEMGSCSFRIVSPEHTVVVLMFGNDNNDIDILTCEYIDNVALSRRINLLRQNETTLIGPVVIAKKHFRSEQFIKTHKLTSVERMLPSYIAYINYLMLQFLNCDDIHRRIEYNKTELDVYRIIANLTNIQQFQCTISVHITPYGKSIGDDKFDMIHNLEMNLSNSVDDYQIPKVAFSKKEWKFVFNYAEKVGLLDDKNGTRVDMRPILTDPKYGRVIEFDYHSSEDADPTRLMAMYQYYPDEDILKIAIVYDPDYEYSGSNFFAIRSVIFTNVGNFNIKECMVDTDLKVNLPVNLDLPKSEEDLLKSIPTSMSDKYLIGDICVHVLSIYLIIHDRPKRHRIIREEKTSNHSQSQGNRNAKHKSSNTRSDNVVISRVLIPFKDIDEYIEKRKGRGGDYGERNYVVESWNRSGHWREYKSGKKVYINETTCTRRKELNKTAEVVIRL